MTKDELIHALTAGEFKDLPGGTELIQSKDGEGNNFSPVCELAEGMYIADSTWDGSVHPTPEQIHADPRYSEEDDGAPEGAQRVIVFWPVN